MRSDPAVGGDGARRRCRRAACAASYPFRRLTRLRAEVGSRRSPNPVATDGLERVPGTRRTSDLPSTPTNDAYPTALHVAIVLGNRRLIAELEKLIGAFHTRADEFGNGILELVRAKGLLDDGTLTRALDPAAMTGNSQADRQQPSAGEGPGLFEGLRVRHAPGAYELPARMSLTFESIRS